MTWTVSPEFAKVKLECSAPVGTNPSALLEAGPALEPGVPILGVSTNYPQTLTQGL